MQTPRSGMIRKVVLYLMVMRLSSSSQSCTTSLSESIYNYRQEFGRTYHGQ